MTDTQNKIEAIHKKISALEKEKIEIVNESMERICAKKRLRDWGRNRGNWIKRNRKYLKI